MVLVTFGNCWHLLASFGIFWQLLATFVTNMGAKLNHSWHDFLAWHGLPAFRYLQQKPGDFFPEWPLWFVHRYFLMIFFGWQMTLAWSWFSKNLQKPRGNQGGADNIRHFSAGEINFNKRKSNLGLLHTLKNSYLCAWSFIFQHGLFVDYLKLRFFVIIRENKGEWFGLRYLLGAIWDSKFLLQNLTSSKMRKKTD